MMHARTRRELTDAMVNEYGETLVKSLVETITEKTNTPCIEAAEIVLEAWQHTKDNTIAEEDAVTDKDLILA